jgi:hypothetical protein
VTESTGLLKHRQSCRVTQRMRVAKYCIEMKIKFGIALYQNKNKQTALCFFPLRRCQRITLMFLSCLAWKGTMPPFPLDSWSQSLTASVLLFEFTDSGIKLFFFLDLNLDFAKKKKKKNSSIKKISGCFIYVEGNLHSLLNQGNKHNVICI